MEKTAVSLWETGRPLLHQHLKVTYTSSLEDQWHIQYSWLLHGYFFIIFYFGYELARTFWKKIRQGVFCLWTCEKFQREQTSLFHHVHKTQPECFVMLLLLSLATSYLHIRQGLTHAGSSALCFSPVSILREQGDVFHMREHSDHVLVLMDKSTKIWGQVITQIGRFSEKLNCSAAFRDSTAKI